MGWIHTILSSSRTTQLTPPLTNLFKKNLGFEWDYSCEETFEALKFFLMTIPILKLPNWDNNIKILFDAFNFAIGGVLVQNGGPPIAFENIKFTKMKSK